MRDGRLRTNWDSWSFVALEAEILHHSSSRTLPSTQAAIYLAGVVNLERSTMHPPHRPALLHPYRSVAGLDKTVFR